MSYTIKGIYLTGYNVQTKSDGVSKKILSQINCFNKNDIRIDIVDYSTIKHTPIFVFKEFISSLLGFSYGVTTLYKRVIKECSLDEYDFIYIRRSNWDVRKYFYLKKIKKINPNIKILLEIPTFPYDLEFSGRRKILVYPLDRALRKKCAKCIDRIVTYSNDKEIFGVKTINIANAVDYSLVNQRKNQKHDDINLLAVALFADWHGYDRLIKGMANAIKLVKTNKIVLHLVGSGKVLDEYKNIVKKSGLENHVVFHGKLYGSELDDIYNISDIGIDTLGRHRVGVYYNSTLKGKEYCAKGLPIVSGVETDLDALNVNYYKRVPADDTLIDMNEIIDFYHEIYDGKNTEDVIEEIRSSSKKRFDYEVAFSPVIDYLIPS